MNTLFIGIGEMGFGMAKNILLKNKSLVIWNRTKDKPHVNELMAMGAQFAENIGRAVSSADFVCFNLTEDKAVRAVAQTVVPYINKDTVILDFSTVSPDTAIGVNEMFNNAGAFYLDCPVSGGSAGAEAGTLTIMAGGENTLLKEPCRY